MISRILLSFLLSIFLTHLSHTQIEYFEEGIIISQSGDTLQCLINRDNDRIISRRVRYKLDENSEPLIKKPTEISAFRFIESGSQYEPILYQYIILENGQNIEEYRFAEKLLDGYFTLYKIDRFPDEFYQKYSKVPSHTFFLEQNGEYYPLSLKEERILETKYRLKQEYKGALRFLMQDWNKSIRLIDKLKYHESAIINLVKDYNSFKDPGYVPLLNKKEKEKETEMEVRTYLPFSIRSDNFYDNGYGLGAMIYIRNLRKSNSLFTGIGLELGRDLYLEDGSGVENKLATIRVPLVLRYFLSQQHKLNTFLTFGLTNQLLKENKNISGPYLRLALGGGLQINRFSLDAKIELDMSVESKREGINPAAPFALIGINYRIN